jgi:hypothetical protein
MKMITKTTKIEKALLLFIIVANLSFIKYRPKDYTLDVKTKQVFMQGSQKYLTATVKLTNNTSDTLKYLSWSCSFQMFYLLKSEAVKIAGYKCTKNIPVVLILPPNKSNSVELNLKVNEGYTKPIKYTIGIRLAKNERDNSLNQLLHKPMKYLIIWADEATSTN